MGDVVRFLSEGGYDLEAGRELTAEQLEQANTAVQIMEELLKDIPCKDHPDGFKFATLWFDDGELRGSMVGCCKNYCESIGPIVESVLGVPMIIYPG